jgi:hypothetical protein
MDFMSQTFRRNEAIARKIAAEIVDADTDTARKMIAILASAKALLAGLEFRSGYCPVQGYDLSDVLAALDDMAPKLDNATMGNMADFAYDRANEELGR